MSKRLKCWQRLVSTLATMSWANYSQRTNDMNETTTLSSNAIPGQARDLGEFCLQVHHFDWYTDYSDDHRVYMRGRAAHDAVEAFAKNCHPAAMIWKDAQRAQALSFMASQLIGRVADFVLCEADGVRDPEVFWTRHKELTKFCIEYLAGARTSHNLLTSTLRDRIGDLIKDCPPDWKDKDQRKQLIDKWIEDWKYDA
jgi:hypothetical protein